MKVITSEQLVSSTFPDRRKKPRAISGEWTEQQRLDDVARKAAKRRFAVKPEPHSAFGQPLDIEIGDEK